MSLKFYLGSTNADLTAGQTFDKYLEESTETASTINIVRPDNTTFQTDYGYARANSLENYGWITGTITVKVRVTAVSRNVVMKVSASRINSSGVVQDTTTETAEQTLGTASTTYTFTIASKDWGATSSTDRLRINFISRGTHSVQGGNITIETGTTETEIATPFVIVHVSGLSEFEAVSNIDTIGSKGSVGNSELEVIGDTTAQGYQIASHELTLSLTSDMESEGGVKSVGGETNFELISELESSGNSHINIAYFQYREKGNIDWLETTPIYFENMVEVPGTFSDVVSGLDSSKVYEYRSVLEYDNGFDISTTYGTIEEFQLLIEITGYVEFEAISDLDTAGAKGSTSIIELNCESSVSTQGFQIAHHSTTLYATGEYLAEGFKSVAGVAELEVTSDLREPTENVMTYNRRRFLDAFWREFAGNITGTTEQGYSIPDVTDGGGTLVTVPSAPDGDVNACYYSFPNQGIGKWFAGSAWIYNVGEYNLTVNVGNGITMRSSSVTVQPGQTIKVEVLGETTLEHVHRFNINRSNKLHEIKFIGFQLQVEQKRYVTPFYDGIRVGLNGTKNVEHIAVLEAICDFEISYEVFIFITAGEIVYQGLTVIEGSGSKQARSPPAELEQIASIDNTGIKSADSECIIDLEGSIEVTGIKNVSGNAELETISNIELTGNKSVSNILTLEVISDIELTGTKSASDILTLEAISSIEVIGVKSFSKIITLESIGSLEIVGSKTAIIDGQLEVVSSLESVGIKSAKNNIELVNISDITVQGDVYQEYHADGESTLSVISDIEVTGIKAVTGLSELENIASIEVLGQTVTAHEVSLITISDIDISGSKSSSGLVEVEVISELDIVGYKSAIGLCEFEDNSEIDISGLKIALGAVEINTISSIEMVGIKSIKAPILVATQVEDYIHLEWEVV